MASCPLPDYEPVLSPDLLLLLRELPWWQEYSSTWAAPQPSPADIKVEPPRLPNIASHQLHSTRDKLQWCTHLPKRE